MGAFVQDLKYGLRIHSKTPGFTIVAVLTIALGIGASAAVFSVVDAILLKPLPYRDPRNIVMTWRVAPAYLGDLDFPWSPKEFRFLSQESKTFQHMGAFKSDSFNLTGSGEPFRLEGLRVSAGFFPALGISAELGRTFHDEDDQPGRERVAVLGHQLWRERFGGDSSILGRTIELNGYAYTVIGVMPSGFAFPRAEEMPAVMGLPREAQIWVPLALPAAPVGPNELGVIARLRPGITTSQAQAEMNVFENRLENLIPAEHGMLCRVTPLERQVVGDTRRPLLLIFGAVGVVLLIVCSNVANLILAKSLQRTREFSLRAALGAGRRRIMLQLLTESLLLSAAGGLAGTAFAAISIHFVRIFGPSGIPRLREITLDLRVLLFSVAMACVTGVFFGLAPSLGTVRRSLTESLKERREGLSGSMGSSRMRDALLISQISLALILVISGGLLVRTFYHLLSVDPGFNPAHVLTFELSLPASQYKDVDRMAQLYGKALRELQSAPGVESAGLVSMVPMGGASDGTTIRIPDHPVVNEKAKPYANYSFASPGYFATVGTPLLRGRDFQESDRLESVPVTIINSTMAKRFWPGEDAIGKQVGVTDTRWPVRTIVGIVADMRRVSLREDPVPEMYVPYTQNEIKIWPAMQVMQVAVRARADAASLLGPARKAIAAADPDLPMAKLAPLATLVEDSLAQPRFTMLLLGSFGVLALLLASVGLFGVISYSVAQRTQEIGIRMALGAQRRGIFVMVLHQGARFAGLGIMIGVAAAFAVTRMMEAYLDGVQPGDPLTFVAASLLWAGVSLLATYVPARRATRVDPMVALRYQ